MIFVVIIWQFFTFCPISMHSSQAHCLPSIEWCTFHTNLSLLAREKIPGLYYQVWCVASIIYPKSTSRLSMHFFWVHGKKWVNAPPENPFLQQRHRFGYWEGGRMSIYRLQHLACHSVVGMEKTGIQLMAENCHWPPFLVGLLAALIVSLGKYRTKNPNRAQGKRALYSIQDLQCTNTRSGRRKGNP